MHRRDPAVACGRRRLARGSKARAATRHCRRPIDCSTAFCNSETAPVADTCFVFRRVRGLYGQLPKGANTRRRASLGAFTSKDSERREMAEVGREEVLKALARVIDPE